MFFLSEKEGLVNEKIICVNINRSNNLYGFFLLLLHDIHS